MKQWTHIAAAASSFAALLAFVVPSVAAADSGSITGVAAAGDGQVVATYTSTFARCTSSGYCGWFPQAAQVPASTPCPAALDGSHITYVGENQESGGTQTGTDTFYPAYPSTRICLYAYHDGQDFLLADSVYPPAAAPTPTAPTTPTGTTVRPLSIAEARGYVPSVLRKQFRSRFKPASLTRSCYRLTSEKVRCRVAWRRIGWRYSGSVTLWNDPSDPVHRYLYRVSVRRGF
jgi:hypothetical protein